MSTFMRTALWLVVVAVSSAFFYHYGASLSTQSNTAVCDENMAAYAFGDMRRALEMIDGAESERARQNHLINLRIAVVRLADNASALRGRRCNPDDRSALADAKRALDADPQKPEWLDAKTAPALALCPDQG